MQKESREGKNSLLEHLSPNHSIGGAPAFGSPDSKSGSIKSVSGEKISAWQLLTDRNNLRAIYVLLLMLITYMFNQVDRYLQAITAENMQKDQNWGPGDGTGSKEDFLVGTVFTSVYLLCSTPMGYIADKLGPQKKPKFLAIALAVWSASIVWTGFSNHYYEVVIARFILGVAQSACTPLAASIISDRFIKSARTTALGIYNWGIYTGFALANGVANYMTDKIGWRFSWWFFGFGGLAWSILVFSIPSIKEPPNQLRINPSGKLHQQSSKKKNNRVSMMVVLRAFIKSPSIVILIIASLIRNAGGYVWAYNAKDFFQNVRNQSGSQQSMYMQWIPLIAGCLGSFFGGFISDRYVKGSKYWQKILILVVSNLSAAPFAALALLIPAPYCYFCLIPSNVIGEMWVGICLALMMELVPASMKTTSVSVYFTLIGFAGFFPQAVTVIEDNVFGHSNDGFRNTLLVLFPGLYVISSVIFLLALITMKRDSEKAKKQPFDTKL